MNHTTLSEATESTGELTISPATLYDLREVETFLKPFMDAEYLLPRTAEELSSLLRLGFVARVDGVVVGFAAIEIYSRKLAELQCLAVDPRHRRRGIGRELVTRCVQTAKEQNVVELMAISSSEELFQSCGFDYSLPNQKRALFIQPHLL
jgi:amino-acid N-acetyltransferase